jgi:hypothetical protein
MNVIVFAIVLTGIILLIYTLTKRSCREVNSEQLQEEVRQHLEGKSHRFTDESSLLSSVGNSWLTQQPETDTKPIENVTSSPKGSAGESRCPACGASITTNDERCPSCEISFVTDGISFVTDGLHKWTPRTVGPADGIYRPPSEIRK